MLAITIPVNGMPHDGLPSPAFPSVTRAFFLFLPGLILLACACPPVAAQNAIHRCVGADGHPVFTDQPCSSVGATSVMPPTVGAASGDPGDGPSAGLLCAKDLAALREGVARAFALHSANRIGGMVLWSSGSNRAATDGIRGMDDLVRLPLVSLEGDESAGIDVVTTLPASGGSTRRTHFGVVRDSGCLWLRPPG